MLKVLSLFYLASTIQCFNPNCVFENQFRNFAFPIEACSENFQGKCKFQSKGYFKSVGQASLVKIHETAVVPTCAFFNAENLKCIYGVNSKIKVLATGSFINLPNLESVHLAFNQITELRQDIFKNISTELLDLSWNKILFIDSNAFKEVSNLKWLNLSRNFLQTVPVNHLAKTLRSLNLAYNLLESFALNSESFVNLTSVDVSNNVLNKVAISFRYPAEKFDLTNNRIQNFDYMDINSVSKLKIGKNLFEETPRYMENINVNELDIYPNPWKCDKLLLLWEVLVSLDIRLAPKEAGKNPPPECFNGQSRFVTESRSTDCLDDYECPSFMTCRAKKCWDPCEQSLCHSSSLCETKQHVLNCSCSEGFLSDPLDIQAECKNVECFTDKDCNPSFNCWDQKCINSQYGEISSGIESANRPAGGYDHIQSGGYGSAFSGGYGSTSGGGYGAGYSSGSAPSIISNKSPYIPFDPPEESVAPEVPWWFDDIPSVVPPEKSKKIMATGF